MNSHHAIVEMIKSAAMRPYLDSLGSGKDREDFEWRVLDKISIAYPAQRNGRVIFPFKRLFFVAYK